MKSILWEQSLSDRFKSMVNNNNFYGIVLVSIKKDGVFTAFFVLTIWYLTKLSNKEVADFYIVIILIFLLLILLSLLQILLYFGSKYIEISQKFIKIGSVYFRAKDLNGYSIEEYNNQKILAIFTKNISTIRLAIPASISIRLIEDMLIVMKVESKT